MNKLKSLLIVLAFLAIPLVSIGQSGPQPPPPPTCPSDPNNKVGGSGPQGAPLEDGAWLMVGMVFLYGAYRVKKLMKKPSTTATEDNSL